MKKVTLRQLQAFIEVARDLSFVRAAEALHLTPPAVTMQIKELESAVGLPMFDRQGRRVALTTAGEYMLVYARRVFIDLKEAEEATDSSSDRLLGFSSLPEELSSVWMTLSPPDRS